MYTIIEFLEDNSCEMVPICWIINESLTYYPPIEVKFYEVAVYIRKCRPADPLTWRRLSIKILGQAANFQDGRKKLNKAINQSGPELLDGHLSSTDTEQCGRGKRKRTKTSQALLSDDDVDPKITKMMENLQGNSDGAPERQHDSMPSNSYSVLTLLDESSDEDLTNTKVSNILRNLPVEPENSPYLQSKNKSSDASTKYRSKENIAPRPSNDSALELVLKQISYLRHEVRELKTSVDILNQKMIVNTDKASSKESQSNMAYPIQTMDSLDQLEEECKDQNLRSCLVDKLRSFGGSNYGDHARRALRFLFTDSFILSFTWQGSKEKKQFSKLHIAKIVVDAVSQEANKIPRHLVENVIKTWLRHAKERVDYKNNKDSKSQQ